MLAFDARPHGYPDIFILECDSAKTRCGEPKPLAMTPAVIPGWSAEGEFIYLASNRTGSWEVWRVAVSGGRPLQVTTNGGYMSRESRDGKWLYFSKDGKDNICSEPAPYLVLDLSGVSFLDSAGVGALVGLFMNRRSIGKKLALAAVAQQGIAVLQVSGLVRLLPLYASVDLAVQQFRT